MTCPQPATIADLVDGRLSPLEISDVERHLDACSRCAELVAVAVSSCVETTDETVIPGGGTAGDNARREAGALIPPGTRLGRYEVRRWIGRGGMGDVYEGFDPKLERRVGIKLLRGRGSDGPAAQRRLEREAKTLARLSSANVVAALDIGIYADRVFLVMELVEGPTLAGWQRAAPRTWREILDVFLQAGDGLAAAHEVGVIHRDFKPQNVLIGADGKARVSDFGLARAGETEAPGHGEGARGMVGTGEGAEGASPAGRARQTLTETGALIGTPRYMAPEQFLKQPVDAKADQFSFCVAMYEALYGRHPFAEQRAAGSPTGSPDTLKEAVLAGRPAAPPPKTAAPRSIAAVLARGMARKAEARFPSLNELMAAIRVAAKSRTRRRVTLSASIALAATLAGASSAWFALRDTGPPILEPTGEPADWTDSRVVFRVPDRIHCLMRLNDQTIRVVWGDPRTAEDVDLTTGTRRATDLLPETYRYGCPVLSPDGRQLIYEGYDEKDRPHIFYATNPTGDGAEPIVASVEPTYESHPLWLSSGKDFLFDLGLQHPAVFSIAANSSTILSDRDRLRVSQSGFFKNVSLLGDRIAIEQESGQLSPPLVNIYRWPEMEREASFRPSRGAFGGWRFGRDPALVFGRISDTRARLAVYDARKNRLSYVAGISGRDVVDFLAVSATIAAVVTLQANWNISYKDVRGTVRTIPRDEASSRYLLPSTRDDGSILFVRIQGDDRWNIMTFRPSDGMLRELTNGPTDVAVASLPGPHWLMTRASVRDGNVEILRCTETQVETAPKCERLAAVGAGMWLAGAPRGQYFAFLAVGPQGPVVQIGSPRGGPLVDLARNVSMCQLVWSGPKTLWFSRREGRSFTWREMDVETRVPTGRTAHGKSGCFDGRPEPSPIPVQAWNVITTDSDVRLHAVP